MRYLDWDVLLFPGEGDGSGVPLKEFKTQCYLEQYDNAPYPTPLLTTFVPSLTLGEPFKISLHSWSETLPILTLNGTMKPKATKPLELWRCRVVIDGVCVCTLNYPIEQSWPQPIATTTSPSADDVPDQLRFPPFHRNILTQKNWDPSGQVGRIRVELSSGYVDSTQKQSHFVKTSNQVNFSFLPAPLDLLERAGIAWPSQRLLMIPPPGNGYFGAPAMLPIGATPTKHKRAVTTNATLMPTSEFGAQPPRYPLNPFTEDAICNYEVSRSTSAYSNFADSAGPLLQKIPVAPTYPRNLVDSTRNHPQFSWRLPSDQLQMIISAIHPPNRAEGIADGTATMLPPPVRGQTTASKGTNFPEEHHLLGLSSMRAPPAPDVANFSGRREGSHYSDVSMHAGCTGFPTCTSEDEEGRIVHHAQTTPSAVVKGRKEGSSPTKRKLSVTSAKKDDYAEKKRRRSSRLLQHDSGHAGSGCGSDERDNGDASEGGGAAVVESG